MTDNKKTRTGKLQPAMAAGGAPFPFNKEQSAQSGFFHALGQFFYNLGFAAEYHMTQVWRVVRNAGVFTGSLLALLAKWLWRGATTILRGLASDLAGPFIQFGRRRRQLAKIRKAAAKKENTHLDDATIKKARITTAWGLTATIGGLIMPVLAVLVLVFTVTGIVNMQYALEVEVNGQVLGYVTDQSVVDGAKSLLRGRIRLAENQELGDWQFSPSYSIARAPYFTTTRQLADEILLTGSDEEGDITPATGFYMNNDLVAVTKEGETLRSFLNEKLAAYEAVAPEGATVDFVNTVECDPDSEEIFFASSVEDWAELETRLNGNVREEERATADGESNLSQLAVQHNITVDELRYRNPEIAGQEDDFVPEAGYELLLQRAVPFLQVKTTYREKSVEVVGYQTVEEENDQLPTGVKRRIQKGEDGVHEVWDDVTVVDGEQVGRQRVDELTVVLEEPVNEVYEVGTMDVVATYPGDAAGAGIAGGYIFPVPGSPYSTRGYSPGGHRGLDINAPLGMTIYAIEGGTVVNAGWHYSFGNYVEIAHPGGITSLYAHCSALYVTAGQQVGQGTPIGAVGSTGNSSGNHCHLEVMVGGQLTDPVPFVGYPY